MQINLKFPFPNKLTQLAFLILALFVIRNEKAKGKTVLKSLVKALFYHYGTIKYSSLNQVRTQNYGIETDLM